MNQTQPRRVSRLRAAFAERFNLLSDKAPDDIIERRIRETHDVPFTYDDAVVKLIASRCTTCCRASSVRHRSCRAASTKRSCACC